MCRSIKTLRSVGDPATEEEVRAAALQFVRKISGYRSPSRVNADAFESAVAEIASVSQRLLGSLVAAGGGRRQAAAWRDGVAPGAAPEKQKEADKWQ